MKLHKIYSETIKHLPEAIREDIIRESPHTRIMGPLPPGLEFLGGTTEHFVDLGFENLGLPGPEKQAVFAAFMGRGVAIPNTNYKLRYANTGTTVVEPIEAGEELVTLPEYWAEAVLVVDGWEVSYAGKLVRPGHNANT